MYHFCVSFIFSERRKEVLWTCETRTHASPGNHSMRNEMGFAPGYAEEVNGQQYMGALNGLSVDMEHLKYGEVNLGTSIMAIKFKGGVILGADSRTSTGAYVANRVSDKITFVSDKIYVCRSGSAADTQVSGTKDGGQSLIVGNNRHSPPAAATLCCTNRTSDCEGDSFHLSGVMLQQ